MTAEHGLRGVVAEAGDRQVLWAVTVIIGAVVGLTFVFGFGNVLSLALRLGVPVWVAPLVAPTVDLSVLALWLPADTSPCAGRIGSSFSPLGDF
ncbi:hypothetical protein [Saccharothrix xinjiangensis]|uniref:Uncharacterized protein n=1 Tax=Saccharothrix xinjiangensis TaxID=204798 RepID=A0ABV9Y755_9PSEU